MWWRSTVCIGILFGILFAVLPNFLWLVSWITGKLCHCRVNYAPFGWCSILLVIWLWGALVYGHYYGRFKLTVNEVEFSNPDIPLSFDGFRIVHISDLHVDSFEGHPNALERIVDKVNEQTPDIILFTGDLATGGFYSIQQYETILRKLLAREGVVSVLGNHDFFIYDHTYNSDSQRCEAAERLTNYERMNLGWKVLRNESFLLHRGPDSIAIAGVDNMPGRRGFPTIRKGNLRQALHGLNSVFTILLSHDPGHWTAEVLPCSLVQLTLSGHTHAAQIRLLGWSLARISFPECDGRYDIDSRMLYVNAGIGCTAPFRIGCPSEIAVITLRRK